MSTFTKLSGRPSKMHPSWSAAWIQAVERKEDNNVRRQHALKRKNRGLDMTLDQSGENVSLHTWKAYSIYFDNMTANENIFGVIFVL
jgi:hypothetical protein